MNQATLIQRREKALLGVFKDYANMHAEKTLKAIAKRVEGGIEEITKYCGKTVLIEKKPEGKEKIIAAGNYCEMLKNGLGGTSNTYFEFVPNPF